MKACDEKLKACLLEAMRIENAELEAEVKEKGPHEFSKEYREKMEKILVVRKRKHRLGNHLRFAAACLVVVLMTGSLMIAGSTKTTASKLNIDILSWLEDFFDLKEDEKAGKNEGIIFDDSQIGYIPDGFEMVEEISRFSNVAYKFEDESGNFYFGIRVNSNSYYMQIDNDVVIEQAHVNDAGYEYTITKASEEGEFYKIIWKDKNDLIYYVYGNISIDELINIMNKITYQEE